MPKPIWKKNVKNKLTYLASFNWSRAFWKLLNGSETMNIVVMKRLGVMKSIAQLWVIRKIEYAILVINQFLSYMVKLYLIGNNCNNLRLILRKWGNFSKEWDSTSLKSVVNFLTRPNKVKELIKLIVDNKKAWDVVETIYW